MCVNPPSSFLNHFYFFASSSFCLRKNFSTSNVMILGANPVFRAKPWFSPLQHTHTIVSWNFCLFPLAVYINRKCFIWDTLAQSLSQHSFLSLYFLTKSSSRGAEIWSANPRWGLEFSQNDRWSLGERDQFLWKKWLLQRTKSLGEIPSQIPLSPALNPKLQDFSISR